MVITESVVTPHNPPRCASAPKPDRRGLGVPHGSWQISNRLWSVGGGGVFATYPCRSKACRNCFSLDVLRQKQHMIRSALTRDHRSIYVASAACYPLRVHSSSSEYNDSGTSLRRVHKLISDIYGSVRYPSPHCPGM